MAVLTLAADGIEARVSARGGRLIALDWRNGSGRRVPLLCEADEGAGPGDRSAFPLFPFGNRLEGNGFVFEGHEHRLSPNTADPFYLHGDGWLGEWSVEDAGAARVRLAFAHAGEAYRYEASQEFSVEGGALRLVLSVVNRGPRPMPFGLGWHPYLPRTPGTRLHLRARRLRTERPGHLPGEPAPLPADLDFAEPGPLPARWVNNGLEGWGGRARILWPERQAGLDLAADPVFAHAFLFLPDAGFSPAGDWFCFEPMTHLAGGHHQGDLGGLAVLAPGETLSGALGLSPFPLASGPDSP